MDKIKQIRDSLIRPEFIKSLSKDMIDSLYNSSIEFEQAELKNSLIQQKAQIDAQIAEIDAKVKV